MPQRFVAAVQVSLPESPAAGQSWSTQGRSYPVTDAALAWLLERGPAVTPSEPVLLWGDARVGNIVFAPDLSVAAIIDWEFASIGPPKLDVAYWLTFEEFLTDASGIARLEGFPGAQSTVDYYCAHSGRQLPDLAYYEVCTHSSAP